MRKVLFLIFFLLSSSALYSQEVLKVDDALSGTTKGKIEGGQFVEGGWQATAGFDSRITYDLGVAYGEGRLEIDATNFLPCEQPNAEKTHILSMWQSENQDRDSSANAGESHWIVRTGQGYFNPCEYKFLTRPICYGEIDYESRLERGNQWNPSDIHHFAIEWRLNGNITLKRNGDVVYNYTHIYPLYLRYFLLGRDRVTKPNYGEQPGVIYSNLKIYVNESSKLVVPPCPGYDAGYEDISQDYEIIEDAGEDLLVRKVSPMDDTFVQKLSPDTVFGLQDTLQVGGDGSGGFGRVIYLKFDLTEFSQYEIVDARLIMYVNNGGYGGGVSYLADNNWEEESLTFNNAPIPDGNISDTKGFVNIGDMVVWNVTNIMKKGEINSLNIISYQDDGSAFYSKEHSNSNLRPYVEIRYRLSNDVDGGAADIATDDIERADGSPVDSFDLDDTWSEDNMLAEISADSTSPDSEISQDIMYNGDSGGYALDIVEISKDVLLDTVGKDESPGSCSCNLLE